MRKNKSNVGEKKRVFGLFEVVFDSLYLMTAFGIGFFFLFQPSSATQKLASLIVFILAIGDSFHLIPRILEVLRGNLSSFRVAMGWGKLISSITMTLFYVLLWQLGLTVYSFSPSIIETSTIYIFAIIRIILCFFPQNKWFSETQPLLWAIWRNIPFLALGVLVCSLYFSNRLLSPSFAYMWLAILLSFTFYVPVVLFAERNRKVGMLMLPKTCMYIWMLVMLIMNV